jgi:hypothetical protein
MKQAATTCAAASMPFKADRMTVCILTRTSRKAAATALVLFQIYDFLQYNNNPVLWARRAVNLNDPVPRWDGCSGDVRLLDEAEPTATPAKELHSNPGLA